MLTVPLSASPANAVDDVVPNERPPTVPQESAPLPFVVKTCPLVP